MRLLVYGSREFARVVRRLLEGCGHEFVGYVDDRHEGSEVLGPYESVRLRFPPETCGIALAIGYNDLAARWRTFCRVRADGYEAPILYHPRAWVDDPSRLGMGAMVMAGATVNWNAAVGEVAVLWPGAIVNHDARIGRNCFLSPGATVCGFATVGDDSFVGAGTVVVDHGKVPPNSFVKAASLWK